MRHREGQGHKYYGGAAARITALVPKDVKDTDELIDAIEEAVKREERYYT